MNEKREECRKFPGNLPISSKWLPRAREKGNSDSEKGIQESKEESLRNTGKTNL
jgi:hypothetical protein